MTESFGCILIFSVLLLYPIKSSCTEKSTDGMGQVFPDDCSSIGITRKDLKGMEDSYPCEGMSVDMIQKLMEFRDQQQMTKMKCAVDLFIAMLMS